jgi:hypothetical protein
VPKLAVDCPWCGVFVVVVPGGWAYRRSQIVIHLLDCESRPPEITSAEINLTADRAMESADAETR